MKKETPGREAGESPTFGQGGEVNRMVEQDPPPPPYIPHTPGESCRLPDYLRRDCCGACSAHDGCEDDQNPRKPEDCQSCGACAGCIAECEKNRTEEPVGSAPVSEEPARHASFPDLPAQYTAEDMANAQHDAYARGISDGQRLRTEKLDALTRGAYEDGRGDGLSEGRRQAAEETERLQALLDQAEQYARDLQDGRLDLATWDAGDQALRGFARALDESATSGLDLAEMLDVLQLPADATPAQMLHGMSALLRSALSGASTDAELDDEETPWREMWVARVRRLMAESSAPEGRRQATGGWERNWAVIMEADWYLNPHDARYPVECDSEAAARQRHQRGGVPGRTLVSRLVGPWEPAEQPGDGAR